MWFPMLHDKIHELSVDDYKSVGLKGNPAPSELRRLQEEAEEEIGNIRVPREPLESELKELIDQYAEGETPKHIYLYSREGGTGQSYTQNILREYCQEKDLPFMKVNYGDIEEGEIEAIKYLMALADVEKVVLFGEPGGPEFYQKLLEIENIYIVGRGYEDNIERWNAEDKFQVFRLDEDYSLSDEQLYEILMRHLKAISIEKPDSIISDKLVREISQITGRPGRALNILGVCLAVYAYRAKTGREPRITEYDVQNCSNRRVIEWFAH